MNKVNFLRHVLPMFVAMLGFCSFASAQAILPTSYGFDNTPPTGWSDNLTGTLTYATGQAGLAGRLDATSEWVQVFFAEEPGAITYYIKGSVGSGTTSWSGTFTVQESADGSNWTALHTFGNGQLNIGGFDMITDNPQTTTRYIRFFFTNKVSGSNVALDEINLATPTAGAAQEINVTQGGNNVPTGFTVATGNAPTSTFTIENLGLNTALNISSITLSGANQSEFSLSGIPTSVSASSSADFVLNFNPVGTGSRFCTITISNDDSNESNYIINVYAIAGSFATEPTAQATGLSFSNVTSWDHNVSFNAGNPAADKYIVLVRSGSAVTDFPVDGTSYIRGQWIGTSKVAYVGSPDSFNARSIVSNTNYHYAVIAFNGTPGYENYLTNAPTTGVAASPAANCGSYYSGINHNSATLISDLTTKMNPANYFQIYYSNYSGTIIPDFYVNDTVVSNITQNYVACQYSEVPYIYENAFIWWNGSNTGTMSREHCFPQSWMPTYLDDNFSDSPPVSDLHILLPVLQEECNAVRSNYPYGEVQTVTSTYADTKYGQNEFGQTCYEPRDAIKGDVARAIFYCNIKNIAASQDWSLPEQISLTIQYGQNEYLLKKWHFQDLPDNMELARNEYVQSEQNNRNAFIDSTLLPCYIRFSNNTKWTPQALLSGTQLQAFDQALSYQWNLNGQPIDGATSNIYTPTEGGVYSVTVQQFAECPAFTSSDITIGLDEMGMSGLGIEVYPNPNNGNFRVSVQSNQHYNAKMRVMDMSGKVVHLTNLNVAAGSNNYPVELNLPAGMYFVELITDKNTVKTRLVVE